MLDRSRGTFRSLLIITADDFGRDSVCTAAIAAALECGKITATSIMANGASFDDACAIAQQRGFIDKVGVHLVLDEGPPLSSQMRRYADANGNLCVRRTLRPLEPDLERAIEAELSAQVERVVAAGIRPTHLDSHRHIHTALPIGRLVVRVARRFGIAYVRPARNISDKLHPTRSIYKWAFNRYIALHVKTARRFGDVQDIVCDRHRPARGLTECMIHLDGSARGLADRRLLDQDSFRRAVERYALVDHASAGH